MASQRQRLHRYLARGAARLIKRRVYDCSLLPNIGRTPPWRYASSHGYRSGLWSIGASVSAARRSTHPAEPLIESGAASVWALAYVGARRPYRASEYICGRSPEHAWASDVAARRVYFENNPARCEPGPSACVYPHETQRTGTKGQGVRPPAFVSELRRVSVATRTSARPICRMGCTTTTGTGHAAPWIINRRSADWGSLLTMWWVYPP